MTSKSSHLHSVGQVYHQFRVTKYIAISELQCILRELVHEPTGAQVMHIGNQDPENLFCLSFQTLPHNSNGVAHILEHTVLCGSQNFPVKDPFFAMTRRSLNTFMNALTGADFTCYPAASQVPKDFYNLLQVYLDAVFHPNLNELSFLQEGHRLEFADPKDSSSPLEYKGIVYNEMKGAMSSATARLSEAINETLFPDLTYGFNSGGDPRVIPTLTYEELKKFYQTFYHPSRCLFFFYGNMPLEKHLDFIAEHTLNHTQPLEPLPPLPFQPRFQEPRYRELTYPISPGEDLKRKTLIAFGWLTCHILEQEEALALNILEIILLDTDASPLKMALLKSGWCTQVNSFIDTELSEVPWGITLRGCDPEHADSLEELLFITLKEIRDRGIPLQMIENAIHQLEFHRSEITGDHAPFGLSLFMRSALLKQHGANPEQGLMIHSLFDKIRQKVVAEPGYFSHLIDRYLIQNKHFVRIVMRPDPDMGAYEVEAEQRRLQSIQEKLTPKEKEEIVEKAQELAEFQKKQEEEDIDILPKVSLQDIPLGAKDYPLIQEPFGPATIFHHSVFTNEIVYADLAYELPDLAEEDLFYLRLFTVVLTQIGCKDRDYKKNLEYIQGHTGGIGAGISFNLQAHNHNLFHPTFHLRGKALHRKASKLFPLIYETLSEPHLEDLPRVREILFKHFTAMEGRLNQSALKYAINLSASGVNIASKIANDLYGLPYFWRMREVIKHFDEQGPQLIRKLQEIHQKVTTPRNPDLIIACDGTSYDQLKGHGFYGLKELRTESYATWKDGYPLESIQSQGRIIASPVAFIGHVFETVSYTHPAAPALNLAAYLFDNLTLHSSIREQGGAYGGGAVSNALSGNFYFYSYRDPNISNTLKAFESAIESVVEGDFDEEDLEEAKLEIIQGLDSPISPGSRAEVAYGWWREGRTLEVRQQFRNQLLSLTKKQVIEAVAEHIKDKFKTGKTVVFAGQELLEKENAILEKEGYTPLIIEPI